MIFKNAKNYLGVLNLDKTGKDCAFRLLPVVFFDHATAHEFTEYLLKCLAYDFTRTKFESDEFFRYYVAFIEITKGEYSAQLSPLRPHDPEYIQICHAIDSWF